MRKRKIRVREHKRTTNKGKIIVRSHSRKINASNKKRKQKNPKKKSNRFIVAPSYGIVFKSNERGVSIFIPFKANHNLFAPISGEVEDITSKKGKFKKNIFETTRIKRGKVKLDIDGELDLSLSSYVGFPYRPTRIRIDKRERDKIKQGEDIGEILLGSMTEIDYKGNVKITPLVKLSDKVIGGKTKIAKWEEKSGAEKKTQD